MSGSDFRKIHLATVGRVAENTQQRTSLEWGGSVACGGSWECLARVDSLMKSLKCLDDKHPNVPGHCLGRPQNHRMKPQLPFHLKIFTVEAGRRVHKGRLKGVTGKHLKIFLYEYSLID